MAFFDTLLQKLSSIQTWDVEHFFHIKGSPQPFSPCCCVIVVCITSAEALTCCYTMKYHLIKCYEPFGIFLSSDKRLPSKGINSLGWGCKEAQSWTENILLSVKHVLGITSRFIFCACPTYFLPSFLSAALLLCLVNTEVRHDKLPRISA